MSTNLAMSGVGEKMKADEDGRFMTGDKEGTMVQLPRKVSSKATKSPQFSDRVTRYSKADEAAFILHIKRKTALGKFGAPA